MDDKQMRAALLEYLRDQMEPEKFDELIRPIQEAIRTMGELLRKIIETIQQAAGVISETMQDLEEMATEPIAMDAPEWPRPRAARPAAASAWPLDQRRYVPP